MEEQRINSVVLISNNTIKKEHWKVIVNDKYPAYISWKTFEKIGSILNDNDGEYKSKATTNGIPHKDEPLLQDLVYCGKCEDKMGVHNKTNKCYMCKELQHKTESPVCQTIEVDLVDKKVVEAFFEELDLDKAEKQPASDMQKDVEKYHQLEITRLEYEANLAQRRYDRVDPLHRLVKIELTRSLETALKKLAEQKEKFERLREANTKIIPMAIPTELRMVFEAMGKSLPIVWAKGNLSQAQKTAILCCLIEKVVLNRSRSECVGIKIVWIGGACSEFEADYST